MTLSTPIPPGAPRWFDLYAADVDAAAAFYAAVFGWAFVAGGPEFGGYGTFTLGGEPVAGVMGKQEADDEPDRWTIYLDASDAADAVERAQAAGGSVVVPAIPVADLGVMAVVVDPAGAAVGIWQPGAHQGFERYQEPGAPSWFELHTHDHAASSAFLRDVFGWDLQVVADADDFRYSTLGLGDDARAGVMDATGHLPPEVPSHWGVYLATEDCDATAASVEANGGSVLMAPVDTPYGRLAVMADPGGAAFRLQQG